MKSKKIAIIILMITTLMLLGIKVEATTGKINSETVRLRKEPNTTSTIIEQLDKNSEVEIIEEEDGWYKIKAKVEDKTVTGYVSKKLVDTQKSNSSTTNSTSNKTQEDTTTNKNENNKVEETTVTEVNKQPEEQPEEQTEEPTAEESNVEDAEPVTKTIETTTQPQENEKYSLDKETEVRAVPLISSKVKTTITGEVTIVEIINDWCRVENDKEIGWIRMNLLQKTTVKEEEQQQPEQPVVEEQPQAQTETTENNESDKTEKVEEKEETKIKTLNKTGYVKAEGLMVRKEASTSSEDIDSLSKNDKVEITGEIDGWYQIKLNGKTGYVSSKYISDTKIVETTSRSGSTIKQPEVTPMEEKSEQKSEKETTKTTSEKNGTSVVEYAKNYLGYKYVSGGSSPTTGFDCSGFTSYVYKNFGVSLSRSSKGQINDGVSVSRDELQPGDIVVFNNSGNTAIGHVGIYIGGDNFIHAANPSQGVTITSLSSSYYSKRYVGARRVN